MARKEFDNTRFLKKPTVIDIIFYISFLASIIVSIRLNKKQLLYVLPIVIIAIFFKYISLTKKKAKPLFIFALLVILISDMLSFYCFEDCFIWISLLTSTYLMSCTLLLKKYLNKGKLKLVLSFSILISTILIGYIVYAILELLISYMPKHQLFVTFLCAFCLIIYTITFAIIYINDNYRNGITLLTSGIFTFFQIALISINEFLYFNKTFTVLIVICHVMAIYLFMNFIAKTKVVKPEDVNEKFI